LIGKKSDSEQSAYFFHLFCVAGKTLENELKTTEKNYISTVLINEELNNRLENLTSSNTLVMKNQEKLLTLAREKVLNYKKTVESLTQDRDKFKTRLETLESIHKNISEDYDKLRLKLKQAKFRVFSQDLEQICINCREIFKEDENFNWSCKVHTSQYSEFWWCCGKAEKEAVGCKVCKHQSREGEKDREKEEKTEKKPFCSVFFI
jgi:chromosome segregation ATPase